MQNLSAAREACLAAGISEEQFYNTIGSFTGTARRLQQLAIQNGRVVYFDFAHAPSKVKATVNAVRQRYGNKKVVAVLELHTYSSLNAAFLPQYHGTLENATEALVYFNPHAIAMKKLPEMKKEEIKGAFGGNNLQVFNDSSELIDKLKSVEDKEVVFLLMSSGDFNGTDMQLLAANLVNI